MNNHVTVCRVEVNEHQTGTPLKPCARQVQSVAERDAGASRQWQRVEAIKEEAGRYTS